jgi:hypothetical protein
MPTDLYTGASSIRSFTCAEAELHRPSLPAVSTKNLFLCDKKARASFWCNACENHELDELSSQLGWLICDLARRKPDASARHDRGAVTMMEAINDTNRQVELWIDCKSGTVNIF